MPPTYRYLFWSYLAISALLIAAFGYIASTESEGQRKRRAALIATVTFASWLLVGPGIWALYESHLPVYEFTGVLRSVRVDRYDSKHYSAWLMISTATGGDISVHASEASPAWVSGQRLWVRYYGETGEMIRAKLLDSQGSEVGAVNSTAGFSRDLAVLIGLFLCWAAYRRYRRDSLSSRGSVDASGSIQIETSLGLEEGSLSLEVMRQLKEDAKGALSRDIRRTLVAGGAFLSCCALVSLFLAGHPLHRYWDAAGEVLLFVALALLIAFTVIGCMAAASWKYLRDLENSEDTSLGGR